MARSLPESRGWQDARRKLDGSTVDDSICWDWAGDGGCSLRRGQEVATSRNG